MVTSQKPCFAELLVNHSSSNDVCRQVKFNPTFWGCHVSRGIANVRSHEGHFKVNVQAQCAVADVAAKERNCASLKINL